jgi:hypothetical protein
MGQLTWGQRELEASRLVNEQNAQDEEKKRLG